MKPCPVCGKEHRSRTVLSCGGCGTWDLCCISVVILCGENDLWELGHHITPGVLCGPVLFGLPDVIPIPVA